MDWKDWLKLTPIYDWFGKRSYSQSGEDMVVDAILSRQAKGFYVDIGAYHPKVLSNTYCFYKRGWRGICVEPSPGAKRGFELVRPRDIFVNVGVGLSEGQKAKSVLRYFVFDEGATNTFSEEKARENLKVGRKLIGEIDVPVRSLESILDEFVSKKQKIDILSVDVEGMDLMVLKSNNWKKYKPKVIIVEELEGTKVVEEYLRELGYEMVGMTGYSLIFKEV